jgi:phenylacetate-CoA ligase
MEMGELTPHYQLIVDRVNNLDTLTVEVEMTESMFDDNIKSVENRINTGQDGIFMIQ